MRNMWIAVMVLALGVGALGQVEPLGIVVEPPAGDLAVTVTTDKPAYAVGEAVRITFTLNRAAYVYVTNIQSDGCVRGIFPNQYDRGNFFPAGTHTIPAAGSPYQFGVQPPVGTEWLQILASAQPVPGLATFTPGDPFPLLSCDTEGWAVQVLGLVPEPTQRAFDFTSFDIVATAAPVFGTLVVRSSPSSARLYVDGMFRGYTPRTVNLLPGRHDILVKKSGYQDFTGLVYIVAGNTLHRDVVLLPLRPANQDPVAQFTFSPASPAPGAVVSFNAASSYDPDGAIVSYRWDFGNNGVFERTGVTTTWTFPAPGTYIVRLVVTDGLGATGQTIQSVTVASVNQPPVAQFTFTPPAPRPGDWVRFDASGSYDPDGSIVSYQWDVQNDGVFDYTGQIVFHQYVAAGTYTVRLRVTDNQGAAVQTMRTVTVTPVVVNQSPVAQFVFTPAAPTPGATVTFNGTMSYDPDGSIVSYAWDLNGNGIVDRSGPIVSWAYSAAGAYNATLYVTDNQGAMGQTTQQVVVAVAGPPGMPAMPVPGVYVWGTDAWRITVNGASTWTAPRGYRLELRTDGQFINVSTDVSAVPLGLIPEPVTEGWRIVFQGSVTTGRVTHSFQVQNASSIYMDLQMDMDGDGVLDRSQGFVRLRQLGVNPPVNPLVVVTPDRKKGLLVPSLNFEIHRPLFYESWGFFYSFVTTIGALEGI